MVGGMCVCPWATLPEVSEDVQEMVKEVREEIIYTVGV